MSYPSTSLNFVGLLVMTVFDAEKATDPDVFSAAFYDGKV